jgi:hypothetical protein
MELCQGAGSPQCSTPQYWAAHVPNLFCFQAVCPKAPGPPAAALTSAVKKNPGVKAAVATRARHQGVTMRLLFRRLLRTTVGDPYRWMAR